MINGLLIVIVTFSIFVSLISTYRSVNRYLRMRFYIHIMANLPSNLRKNFECSTLWFYDYKLMIIGALLATAGFVLMSEEVELSGEANTAETFDSSIYSQRIILAPILVVLGFIVEVFAIFYKALNLRPNLIYSLAETLKQYS